MKIKPCALVPILTAAAVFCAGCNSMPETPQKKADSAATGSKKPKGPSIPDQNGDTAFQAFLSRLRKAVHNHDADTLASMMTKNFGYRLDPLGEGDGVFAYWDQNNLWPELELVLKERFIPNEDYMVAPPEFTISPENFSGYRAGVRLENGGWKFAYFVSG